MKDDTILSGYRVGMGFKEHCKSLFSFHNETVNIWSHLLGSLFFLYLAFNLQHHISVPLLRNSLHDALYAGQPYVVAERMCFKNASDMREHIHHLSTEINLVDPGWWTEVTSVTYRARLAMEQFQIHVNPLADSMRNKLSNMREQLAMERFQIHVNPLADNMRSQLSSMREKIGNQLHNEFHNKTVELIAAFGNLEKRLSKKASELGHNSRMALERASRRMMEMRVALRTQMSGALASWKISNVLPESPTEAFANKIKEDFIRDYRALATRFNQSVSALEIDLRENSTNKHTSNPSIDLPFWPTFWFLGSAMLCMLFSAAFHLLGSINVTMLK